MICSTICQGWIKKLQGAQGKQEYLNLASQWTIKATPQNHARLGFVAVNEGEATRQLNAAVELIKTKDEQESAEQPDRHLLPPERVGTQREIGRPVPGAGFSICGYGPGIGGQLPAHPPGVCKDGRNL